MAVEEALSLSQKVDLFPQTPGVYLMKGADGKIIYVGKAKSLKSRVKSYFLKEGDGRYQIQFLMRRVLDIDYLVTQNEKEALLLENSLIKKHRPRYNIFLKDDKSYVSLRVNIKHDFPRIFVTRKIRRDGSLYFGPYSSAEACRETVELLQRYFKLRTCSDSEIINRTRPCMEFQIKRCTAPCVGMVSKDEYRNQQVEPVRLFLEGKDRDLVRQIEAKMDAAAEAEDFEQAAHWRDLLQSMEATLEKQRVVKHGGLHQDIIYLYTENEKGIAEVMHVRNGSLVESRGYPVSGPEEDAVLLENFLNQYYQAAVFIPDEILIPSPIESQEALEELLTEKKGKKVSILIPQKGEKKGLMALAEKNARAQFDRQVKKEYAVQESLQLLQDKLELPRFPRRMECYDISNISGKFATGSRVVFIDGVPDKNHYRQYKIRMENEPNDYAMMHEVLGRRLSNEGDLPDLLVVDGGKGQLNIAIQLMKDLEVVDVPVIGVAKGQGPGARSKGLWEEKKEEEIYLPGRKNPVILKRGSPELMMLQRLRDEAHRFAVKYHRKLRDQKSFKKNQKK